MRSHMINKVSKKSKNDGRVAARSHGLRNHGFSLLPWCTEGTRMLFQDPRDGSFRLVGIAPHF